MQSKITGAIVFILTLTLYVLTLEPTTSFWDCSEFILSAAKLEVNHPAGAPLFMLIGRVFSLFSFGNLQKIALTVNFVSGFFSALTVFFLFHVIVKLVQKLSDNKILILGSAVVGALTFAVSDSFWFSAVEGEVYGLSMFFLVVSLWAVLKWEEGFGNNNNEKWIFFLALITGLGIGVHLLNLLVLPSVFLVMGFKKFGYSIKKMFLFFVAGVGVLLVILYVLIPSVMRLLALFDYIFVNKMDLPLHSGAVFGIAFILLLFAITLYYFRSRQKRLAEIITLSVFLLLTGFSVYAVNIIRSSANPPINFGKPDTIYALIDYLNREQYPKRPLVYGQSYNSPVTGVNERYSKEFINGKYQTVKLAPRYDYAGNTCTWFPRMYSREERHIKAYKNWINIQGKTVVAGKQAGMDKTLVVPTFSDHVRYFVNYQFAYMFGRYFMWNFVGRQNDRQGRGDILSGNWISGIKLIDRMHLGPQNKMPEWLKNNKGRNTYFFIPLLIGLLGGFYHYKKNKEGFFVLLALFVMGSLGLAVYINEIPITPRERDYVFVGAFMAFSVWVGMGFRALANHTRKLIEMNWSFMLLFVVVLLGVPGLMLVQNYNDHNRADRYIARDLAENMLKSCPPNSILFTSGDNDTYPLLYCQEVEGIRTDVRVVIMPFLAADWFINGLRQPKYNDAGLAFGLPKSKYDKEGLEYIPILDKLKRDASWFEAFQFLQLEKSSAKVTLNSGEKVNFLPLSQLNFTVNADGEEGIIPVSLKDKNFLYKHQLVFWDIISSNATLRPICFASKTEAANYGLNSYLQCEGFVYRLVPEKSNIESIFSIGKCNAGILYSRLMNDFNWGNIDDSDVYADWNTIINLNTCQVRNVFNEVAEKLLAQGEKEQAGKLLNRCVVKLPLSKIPHDIYAIRQAELLVRAEEFKIANKVLSELKKNILQTLDFYNSLNKQNQIKLKDDIQRELYYLNQLFLVASKLEDKTMKKDLEIQLEMFYKALVNG